MFYKEVAPEVRKKFGFCVLSSRKIGTTETFSLIRGEWKDTFAPTQIRGGDRPPALVTFEFLRSLFCRNDRIRTASTD